MPAKYVTNVVQEMLKMFVPDDCFDILEVWHQQEHQVRHIDQYQGDVGSEPGQQDYWNVQVV